MTLSWVSFAIVCPLALIGGFVDAIAGGGGFFTLTAYLLAGFPVHNAIATNKLSACMGCTVATGRYIKDGLVPWKLAVFCIPCALLGAAGGARLALAVSDVTFRWIMVGIIPITGYYVLKKKDLDTGHRLEELPWRRTVLIGCAVSLCIGVYDGFYGPGTGTFLLLILSGLIGLDLRSSAGTTKIINCSTNISSLAVYIFSGNIVFALGLVAGVFSIVGNYLGSGSFTKKGNALARPLILTVLVIFFGKLLWELLLK